MAIVENEDDNQKEYKWSDDPELSVMNLFLKDTAGCIPFTDEEEKQIFAKYIETKDPEIRNQIILHNIRLVISLAKQKSRSCGSNIEDHISDGVMGLITAIDKFEPERGYKFSTMATWWIRQAITRGYMNTNNNIRIPVHAGETANQVQRKINDFHKNNGYFPSRKEIKEKLKVSEDDLLQYEYTLNVSNPVSLDKTVGEVMHDDETDLGDFVSDDKALLMFKDIENRELKDTFMEMLEKYLTDYVSENLRERNRDIIMRRFGLDDDGNETLEEIGDDYNISRERVRQITDNFFKYLKRPYNLKRLRDFLYSTAVSDHTY